MNKEILKTIFKLKLETVDLIIDALPEVAKDKAKNTKTSIVKAALEVLNENVENSKGNNIGKDNHKRIESINIK